MPHLLLALVALLHVTLVSSEPAADAHLAASPARFRLEFSEPVDASLAKVTLTGADGVEHAFAVAGDPRNAYVLIAPGRALADGVYRLTWHIVSADGHAVSESFVFTIGEGGAAPPPPIGGEATKAWGPAVAGAPIIPATLRALGVGALCALVGLLFCVGRAGSDARSDQTVRWLAVSAPLFLFAHLIAWLINTSPDHALSGAWMASMFGTTVGRVELARTLLSIAPLLVLLSVRSARAALLAAVPSLLVSAAVGHSAAFSPVLSIPLKGLHLIALAAWLGGLIWLTLRATESGSRFTSDTAWVSSVALTGVVVIGISGVVQTPLLVPTLAGLTSTYGVVVLLKVTGVGALIGFGAYHRFRVMPRLAATPDAAVVGAFVGSLRREITVLWLVVLLGGLLAYLSPPAAQAATSLDQVESVP